MNKDQIKKLMGSIGEEITGEHLGPLYVKSSDEYDSEKDGNLSALLVEIKTSTRIYSTNEFVYEASQFFKLTNVDLFYINEIPLNPEDGIVTYLCTNNKQLKLERRYFEGKYDLYVVVKFDKLLKVSTLKNDSRVDRLIELADKLSPFRREKKASITSVKPDTYETSYEETENYFVVNLTSTHNDAICYLFANKSSLYSSWKNSNKKLMITDGKNPIAIIENYNKIITSPKISAAIRNNGGSWIPTWMLHKQNMIKLFDAKFKKTNFGDIPVTVYNG